MLSKNKTRDEAPRSPPLQIPLRSDLPSLHPNTTWLHYAMSFPPWNSHFKLAAHQPQSNPELTLPTIPLPVIPPALPVESSEKNFPCELGGRFSFACATSSHLALSTLACAANCFRIELPATSAGWKTYNHYLRCPQRSGAS